MPRHPTTLPSSEQGLPEQSAPSPPPCPARARTLGSISLRRESSALFIQNKSSMNPACKGTSSTDFQDVSQGIAQRG